jgi:hypothetical protein
MLTMGKHLKEDVHVDILSVRSEDCEIVDAN